MTEAERAEFLPIVETFTNLLEEDDTDIEKISKLLQQVREIAKLIPTNLRNNIPAIQNIDLGEFLTAIQGPDAVRNVRKPAVSTKFGTGKKVLEWDIFHSCYHHDF